MLKDTIDALLSQRMNGGLLLAGHLRDRGSRVPGHVPQSRGEGVSRRITHGLAPERRHDALASWEKTGRPAHSEGRGRAARVFEGSCSDWHFRGGSGSAD